MSGTEFLSFDVVCVAWAFLAVSYIVTTIVSKSRRIKKKANSDEESLIADDIVFPPVSVIIYSPGWSVTLRKLVKDVFSQDYPAPFEVIVVNGEKDNRTQDDITELQLSYPDLYLTFSPEKSKNLSRKKLALTIGIKAAKYENLIITQSNVELQSDQWLKAMARHFGAGADIVLGYSKEDDESKPRMSAMQRYDKARNSLICIPTALAGKPLIGTGLNLGYRKDLFYKNKGFSDHLNLVYGDDDLFINSIGRDSNCAVELSKQSFVKDKSQNPKNSYRIEKMIRTFSSRFLPKKQYLMAGSISLAIWIWLVATVLGAVFYSSLFVPISLGVLVPALWVPVILSYRSVMKTLEIKVLSVSLPVVMLFHSVYTIFVKAAVRKKKSSFYAWGVYRPF